MSHIEGPLLILAGAGSGKTRVVTHRVAEMLSRGVEARNILALTFTNKAAREMAERIAAQTSVGRRELTVSTFHSFGAMVLRERYQDLGLRATFSIYDAADRRALIKEVAGELGWDVKQLDLYAQEARLSALKTRRLDRRDVDRRERQLLDAFHEHLRSYNAVDFDDLILLPLELLERDRDVRASYADRFRYVTVDEFQDTSALQYELLRLLAGEHRNLCVVGDDDQSIYSWRGANYENILRFERDFPDYRQITLDQNYRSTGPILDLANTLIAANPDRRPKELWTERTGGDAVRLLIADDEQKEAEFIAEQIRSLRGRDGLPYSDVGILVRANSLTRPIEEALRFSGIPYQVSGGTSFFQRREVKDILAYLRLMANNEDEVSLMRILNTPRRGIGPKTLSAVAAVAHEHSCSMFTAMTAMCAASDNPLPRKQAEAVKEVVDLVESYSGRFLHRGLMAQTLGALVEDIGYWGHLVSESGRPEIARWRFDNVESLVAAVRRYETNPDVVDPTLRDYLNRVAIISSDDQEDQDEDNRVNLMTIHAAKGLEFEAVFLAGVEKDLLPHARSIEEGNVEEERRLFYVALTRARSRLLLTACRSRARRGRPQDAEPSPFLAEIPAGMIEPVQAEDFLTVDEAASRLAGLRDQLASRKNS